MGYMHIDNLYKKPEFLQLFKTVNVAEKIHGTSSNITLSAEGIKFFAGGVSHAEFIKLFDQEKLQAKFAEMTDGHQHIIFGESYGGSCQGMSATYGKELKFIAFDVKIITPNQPQGFFMDVDRAEKFVHNLGLDFVWNFQCKNELEALDNYRDQPSKQGFINCGVTANAEGIVVKPIQECLNKFGKRWIVKHKRKEFMETKTPREVNPDKAVLITEANEIAEEFVTMMRLEHVLDKLSPPHSIEKTGEVVKAMILDIHREGRDEFTPSKEISSAIGRKTAELYKQKIGFGKMPDRA